MNKDRTDELFDVAVVGAGPAGIAAACMSAERGKRVVVMDQGTRPGGQIWRHRSPESLPAAGRRWISRLQASGAELRLATTVVALDGPSRALTVVRGHEHSEIRASAVVLATGARELFLPFPGWTLPWVLGAGGAQALLKEGLSFRDRRVVVAGSGPLLLPVAAALIKAGAHVSHVLEQAGARPIMSFAPSLLSDPGRLRQALGFGSTIGVGRYLASAWVEEAFGGDALEGVRIRTRRGRVEVPCDVLCTGFGLVPSVELARVARCAISSGAVTVGALQQTSVQGILCAGESCGVAGVEAAIAEGQAAGLAASGVEPARAIRRTIRRERRMAGRLDQAFSLREEVLRLPRSDTIVCRCEDVTESQLGPWSGWTEMKLQTRMGMGPCQGRVCGGAMSARFGFEPADTRIPVFPSPLAVLAGSDAGDADDFSAALL